MGRAFVNAKSVINVAREILIHSLEPWRLSGSRGKCAQYSFGLRVVVYLLLDGASRASLERGEGWMILVRMDQQLVPALPWGSRDIWTSFTPQNLSTSLALMARPRGSVDFPNGTQLCQMEYQGPSCASISRALRLAKALSPSLKYLIRAAINRPYDAPSITCLPVVVGMLVLVYSQ